MLESNTLLVTPSLSESDVWFLFWPNGSEVKIKYKDGEVKPLTGGLYKGHYSEFIKAVEAWKLAESIKQDIT